MLTIDEFLPGFGALCEVYGRQPSKTLTDIYYDVVKDAFDGRTWGRAVRQVLASRQYTNLPMPAELLATVQARPEDQSLLAWTAVDRALDDHGTYESVLFTDPLVTWTIKRQWGSWPKLCAEMQERHWIAQRFRECYEAGVRRGVDGDPEHLPGEYEIHNAAGGYRIAPPKVVECLSAGKRAPRQIEASAAGLLKEV